MPRHLPSLSVLRAFEATARHLSFTRAGLELSLTQTAISHRIKDLEELLSVQLFSRTQSGISLTEDGRDYLEAIRPALTQIAAATDGVSSRRENRLNVTCLIAFAETVLLPSLSEFCDRYPDVEVRVTPTLPVERSQLRDFDVAIWHGPEGWPGMQAIRIEEETMFPVCSPALLERRGPLTSPADLRAFPVIRNASPIIEDDWLAWLLNAGQQAAQFGSEIFCGGLFFAMAAVRAGAGVGMGRSTLVADDLATGRLIEPFGFRLSSSSAYYIVSPPERSSQPQVKAFTDWLLELARVGR